MDSNTPQFVSLHTHSDMSILDGFSTVEEYVAEAVRLGKPGLGLTDHGNMLGIYDLVKSCQKAGIVPVPGCEFYVAPEHKLGAKNRDPVFYGNPDGSSDGDVSARGKYLHLTVWAVTNEGLRNLNKLTELANHPDHKLSKYPRIDRFMLAEHSQGLVVSTGCPSGEIATRFRLGQDEKAYDYARWLLEVFGRENVYVEVMNHNMRGGLERELLPKQLKLAADLGLELLATNDCHYAHKGEHVHHEEFLAKQTHTKMSEPTYQDGGKRFAFDGEDYYLKSAEEMLALFPEDKFPNAVANTVKIMERARGITLSYDDTARPEPILPPGCPDAATYLKYLVSKGATERFGHYPEEEKKKIKERLAFELEVLISSDFAGYMVLVAGIIRDAVEKYSIRDKNGKIVASPVGPGRGSAAGSAVAYTLYITDVDPIKYGLSFARFLGVGRGNIHGITFDDGLYQECIASDTIKVVGEGNKYVHQLKPGMTIEIDETAAGEAQ